MSSNEQKNNILITITLQWYERIITQVPVRQHKQEINLKLTIINDLYIMYLIIILINL
jgi:hypothetical protein